MTDEAKVTDDVSAADEMSETDEVFAADTSATNDVFVADEAVDELDEASSALIRPIRKEPPRTIVIVDDSVGSYEAERAAADQAGTDQAERGQVPTYDWGVAETAGDTTDGEDATGTNPATRATSTFDSGDVIVFYDDSVYDDSVYDDSVYDDSAYDGTATDAITVPDEATVSDEATLSDEATVPDEATTSSSAVAPYANTAIEAASSAGVSAETPAAPRPADEPALTPSEADALPVPRYDSLSLPSLRARLRNLDIDQVRMLLDYERTHAARADFITMFERRIDKLAATL